MAALVLAHAAPAAPHGRAGESVAEWAVDLLVVGGLVLALAAFVVLVIRAA